MKCERFQLVAGEVARNEIMDADERANALAHAEVCEHCEQVLTFQSRLSEGLRSLARETKTAQAPAGVEGQVLAAFRERTRVRSVPALPTRRHYWASAAVAVLLLAVGVSVWRWHLASLPPQTEQASSKNAAANVAGSNRERSPAGAVSTTQPLPSPLALVPKRLQPRRHSTTPAAELNIAKGSTAEASLPATTHQTKEIATDFVPLGYSSGLDLQEGGQMVRVELPRSALERFGLPMNMNRADERIKADVLVGADGLARAIRFVQAIDQPAAGLRSGNERNQK